MQICFLQLETNSFKLRKINWFIGKKYKMLIETEFFCRSEHPENRDLKTRFLLQELLT